MSSPEAISVLRSILDLEVNSLVRYVIEASKPPLVKAEDHKALACFQDLYRESERGVVAISRLLVAQDEIVSREARWPLNYTHLNYLRPVYLLRTILEDAESRLEAVEGLCEELARSGWPEAVDAVHEIVAREREHLARIRKLAEEYGEMRVDEPKLKGTSASRW